ncbi:ABC transporter substrate-binding protein [Novispirillum itersonii]|uniref:Branched-chain amino acid transport system substrate-binding protein n=1 Tax=Novispirillum itersonii TaxID=189 RepID=A0A7X0DLA4_NOVIT|nr:ABC transporter substrate-binding protein [Novispirillum itersonii]MBB6209823.1 branched-chain amino acid transport system substrate-binding protein [Novispirillum itersonii]
MIFKKLALAAVGATLAASALSVAPAQAQENGQFVPGLVYRTGPYAPGGIPWADGFADYVSLLNARDGGINGVPLVYEECDTAYNNDKGVECYEKLKGKGPTGGASVQPLSTGITYALMDRVRADKIPMITSGYGRADASDGAVFEWIFTAPVTYWAGADAIVQHIEAQEKSLKGKKIALVYHDSAFGKEPIKTLQALAEKDGFKLDLFPVPHPGLEQKATWLKIGRQLKPDWVIMWGWGVMNSTAIKEAAAVGFPMNKFVGVWWSGSEVDVRPAGMDAKGYLAAQFHGAGANYKVHEDILKNLYEKGKGASDRDKVGDILYNRGLISAVLMAEGIRTAMTKYGNKPMTGEQIRWGLENLKLDDAALDKLGLKGLMAPLQLSCKDHEGGGKVMIQQWSGAAWTPVSDWITPRRDGFLTEMYKESAAQYAKEKNITPRTCN